MDHPHQSGQGRPAGGLRHLDEQSRADRYGCTQPKRDAAPGHLLDLCPAARLVIIVEKMKRPQAPGVADPGAPFDLWTTIDGSGNACRLRF